jgi:hypothetical protein
MQLDLADKCICLVGKRCSGKSVLLKHLVTANRKRWSEIFVICPTETINRFYADLTPPDHIFDEYDDEWVQELIETMTKVNAGKPKNQRKRVLLILDDCSSDTNFHQSKGLIKLFTRGRHLNISVILTTQHLFHVPPVARNNSDYVLVSQLNRASVEMLCNEFCAGCCDKAEFMDLHKEATKDYHFFIINQNSVKSGETDEIYGMIKAEL